MSRRFAWSVSIVGALLLVVLGSTLAAGAVATSNQTVYQGSQPDTNQAIEITYTVSPDGGVINNMTVDFDSTQQTFIQSDSFSVTVNPASADTNVESRTGDQFFIQELEPNEEVSFVFQVYPKTIKEQRVDAVAVRMEYIQNGQELTDSETVTANMSSSPWFELQTAEGTIQQQESRLQQLGLVGQLTNVTFIIGLVVGIVGIAFGAYALRKQGGEQEQLKRDHANDLESLAQRMSSSSDAKTLRNEAEKIRDEIGGDGGGSGDDW